MKAWLCVVEIIYDESKPLTTGYLWHVYDNPRSHIKCNIMDYHTGVPKNYLIAPKLLKIFVIKINFVITTFFHDLIPQLADSIQDEGIVWTKVLADLVGKFCSFSESKRSYRACRLYIVAAIQYFVLWQFTRSLVKIARSCVLGIYACCKHSQSVGIGDKLVYTRFELLKKAY